MVFCGKASLSCKNCRTRRIKCNKQEPECSQCVRAGKKCPGYRDQLSLLFRDETVKVRKKFEEGDATGSLSPEDTVDHAQSSPSDTSTEPQIQEQSPEMLAVTAIPSHVRSATQVPADQTGTGRLEDRESSSLSPESTQKLGEALESFAGSLVAVGDDTAIVIETGKDKDLHAKKQTRRRSRIASHHALPSAQGSTSIESIMAAAQMATVQSILRGPGQTPVEQGLHFYLENYHYGHPESPPKGGDITVHIPWILDPSARLIASAIGLAGLGNLAGDDQTRITSWQNYLTGLQMTAKTLKTPDLATLNNAMRCIVLMAMFEIVRGANRSSGNANVHVMGAAALLRHFLPVLPKRLNPYRGLLQLCFSLLIPCIGSKTYVPPVIIEYVTSTYREKPKDDQFMTELLLLLYELTNLLAFIETQVLIDERSDVASIVVQTLQLESRLITWELDISGEGIWKYEECEIASLPPQACFKGRFHRYSDISTARIWSYYRWARILVNQLILQFVDRCPISIATALIQLGDAASPSVSALVDVELNPIERLRSKALRIIRKCAEDTFASTPTNWRHPSIPLEDYAQIASKAPVYGANGGTGVITLMPTLFHLQTAACAPGVPHEDWKWALDVIDTVWAYLGLQQARTLADMMRSHHDAQLKRAAAEEALSAVVSEKA